MGARQRRRAEERQRKKGGAPAKGGAHPTFDPSKYHAIVVFSRKKTPGGGAAGADDAGEAGSRLSDFYLDRVVVGTPDEARVHLEAAKLHLAQTHGPMDMFDAFIAPITSGFRGLTEPLMIGRQPTEFNVWMMRRDGLDGLREYEIKFTKRHVTDAEPDHDTHLWACTKIGEGWQRPDHLMQFDARQQRLAERRAARA